MAATPNVNRKRAATAVTLAIFLACLFGVRWLVQTQRSPGAITVIEAQGMDMSAMQAPPGSQPVTVERASSRSVGGSQEFPATVMAFSDEEIVARVPGRIVSIVYPGDNVNAGQVVVREDAGEYRAQEEQAALAASAGRERAQSANEQIDVLKVAAIQATAEADAAKLGISRAAAERETRNQEVERARAQSDAAAAKISAKQAELTYAEASLARYQKLYKDGIVSLNDAQLAQRARDTAQSEVTQAQDELAAARKMVDAATSRLTAMAQAVNEAKAKTRSAQAAVTETAEQIRKAGSDARAESEQARSLTSEADSAATISGYTELQALDPSMVSERFVAPGSVVSAGERLLMLHRMDKVRVQAQLPESLAGSITVGTPVQIRYGQKTQSATLTSIFPTADTSTRTFTAEAVIENPGHRFLPGSAATLSVQTSPQAERLAVRSNAIQSDASGNHFVWIVTQSANGQKTDWTCPMHTEISEPGPGKCPICKMELVPRKRGGKTVASRRSVNVLDNDGTYTSVTGDLKPDDSVVIEGFQGLIEGASVEPTESSTTVQAQKPAAVQMYTCPMHPEVVQDHPGKCPKCGMELVPRAPAK